MKTEQQIDAVINSCLNKMQEIDEHKSTGNRRRIEIIRDTLGWVLDEIEDDAVEIE